MSFASDARAELAREGCRDICCARSELAAALLCSGGIAWRGRGTYSLSLTSADGATIRHYYALLKQFFFVTCEIRTLRAEGRMVGTRYQLVFPDDRALALLTELELLDAEALFGIRQVPTDAVLRYACCKKAFIRGTFMLGGVAVNPEKSYHLEMDAPTDTFAQKIIEIMNYFEIFAKMTRRKTKYVVYLKRSEDISDVLTLMGANSSTLALENVRIQKEMHNRVNRQMNCDDSNINRMMNTADRQIQDIRCIEAELGLDKLPRALREMAIIRVNNAATPLAGLGELADPPIGKSGVNLRLRRLSEIARKLRSGEDIELKEV